MTTKTNDTVLNHGTPLSFLSLSICTFLLLIAYNYLFNRNHINRDDEEEEFLINPCPNPNCIRCQKYKEIQSSAKRRLPYLIQEWKRNIPEEQLDEKNLSFQLQRIKDGVTNSSYNAKSNTNHEGRATGQRPTVLFIPNLHHPVQENVTIFHSKSCDAFLNNSLIRNIILQEYFDSQINNAQWTTNNIGTSPMNVNQNNNHDQLWEVLYLMNQGQWNHDNINIYCPKTYSFIKEKVVNVMENCIFGNIFISVLYPGTKIDLHCGPTNIRHRLHYGLSIPTLTNIKTYNIEEKNNDCIPLMRVRNEIFKWEEGGVFVFDDSLIHSAEFQNDSSTSEVRVVLVIDLWHPSLSNNERDLISRLYPPLLK